MVVQPGLCRTWSETPKTGFLTIRLLYSPISAITGSDSDSLGSTWPGIGETNHCHWKKNRNISKTAKLYIPLLRDIKEMCLFQTPVSNRNNFHLDNYLYLHLGVPELLCIQQNSKNPVCSLPLPILYIIFSVKPCFCNTIIMELSAIKKNIKVVPALGLESCFN